MVEHKIHLLPVLDGTRLSGVVARLDMIRSLGG
jgi:CBS domain-containing protein